MLLVEDDAQGADAVRQYLEFRGFAVDVSGSAEEALARAQGGAAWPYRVVITDLHLPGMRGEELAQRLVRTAPRPPRLIAISGEHGPVVAPFDVRLPKPCRPRDLVAAIESLLQRT